LQPDAHPKEAQRDVSTSAARTGQQLTFRELIRELILPDHKYKISCNSPNLDAEKVAHRSFSRNFL